MTIQYRILLDENTQLGEIDVRVFRLTGPYNFDTLVSKSFHHTLEKSLILRLIHYEVKQLRHSQKWPFIKRNMQ